MCSSTHVLLLPPPRCSSSGRQAQRGRRPTHRVLTCRATLHDTPVHAHTSVPRFQEGSSASPLVKLALNASSASSSLMLAPAAAAALGGRSTSTRPARARAARATARGRAAMASVEFSVKCSARLAGLEEVGQTNAAR